MRLLQRIGVVFAGLILLLIVVGFLLPSRWHTESAAISAG